MTVSYFSGRRVLVALAGVVLFVSQVSHASAEPIDWSDSYTANGNTFSGQLLGDYDGQVLTLNNSWPYSTLTIDLASPDPTPIPRQSISDPCVFYNCAATATFNSSVEIFLVPWGFDVNGSVEFDDQDPANGTANLTATPQGSGFAIHVEALNIRPSFIVRASQEYGPINQALANAEAAATELALNTGNYEIDLSGQGYWSTIDLGTITAELTELGDMAELDMSFVDIMLNGYATYDRFITFDNGLVDRVAGGFLSLFADVVDDTLTDALIEGLRDLQDNSVDGFTYDCRAAEDPEVVRRVNVSCGIDGNLTLTGEIEPRAVGVNAPAMAGLFGVGLLGLVALRRRRQG